MGERLRLQDFNYTAGPSLCFRGFQQALQQSDCLQDRAPVLAALNFGHQHPGEGQVLELAQVADFILSRQPACMHPILGPGQPALLEIHSRLQGFDGTGIWYGSLNIRASGFIQLNQRGFQVSPTP